jgi:hypothetical protein
MVAIHASLATVVAPPTTAPRPRLSVRPAKVFRAGNVRAGIWSNRSQADGRSITRFSIRIEKRFRDVKGNWQSTSNLFPQDLAKLQLVAAKAHESCLMGNDREAPGTDAES